VGLLDDFDATLQALRRHDPAAAFLPTHISMACAVALDAEGAGISLLSEVRVPLGWNNDDARVVEAAQTTIGAGPCLDAITDGRLVAAGPESIRASWPEFAELFLHRTPFRSLASLPFTLSTDLNGAIDVYWVDAGSASALDHSEALALGARASEVIAASSDQAVVGKAANGGTWLDREAPRRRLQLWTALGLVSTELTLETNAALAAMRTWATQRSVFLDDVVRRLVTGEMTSEQLLWER
jgi:hypothetical protein